MIDTKSNRFVIVFLSLIMILLIQCVHGQNTIDLQNFKEGDILIVDHTSLYKERYGADPLLDSGKVTFRDENKIKRTGFATHAAIVIKNDNGELAIRESFPRESSRDSNNYEIVTFNGGVRTVSFEEFYNREGQQFVKVYRVNNEKAAQAASRYAKNTQGDFPTDPVDFIFPKDGDGKEYCAELVWHSYLYGSGIDFQNPFVTWISPTQISKSDRVREVKVNSGSNSQPFGEIKDFLKSPAYGSTEGESDTTTQNEDLGGVDFSQSQINYIALSDTDNYSVFSVGFKGIKMDSANEKIDFQNTNDFNLRAFFIGLSLPDSKFWVNLNPWESDRIIDADLKKTDLGKVMLLADLQMKRDFSKYENPCESAIGKEYWSQLEAKSDQLLKNIQQKYPDYKIDSAHIQFAPVTRHWIVPGTIDAYKSDNKIFIVNATLTIKTEPVSDHSSYQTDMIDSVFFPQSLRDELDNAVKDYGRYAMETQDQLIRPLVIKDINSNADYARLRQIFVSIALAQAYKKEFNRSSTTSIFSTVIDSNDLSNLESESPWDPHNIWNDYKKSFDEYDYTCTQSEQFKNGNRFITRSKTYIGGGVDFEDISITNVAPLPDSIRDLINKTHYSSYVTDNNNYYFGDSVEMPWNADNGFVTDDDRKRSNGRNSLLDSILQTLAQNLKEHRIYPGQ